MAAYCGTRLKVWDFNPVTMQRSNGRIQANPPNNLREDLPQWSHTTPNKFFACARSVLYEITIPAGTSTTWSNSSIRDFRQLMGAQANDPTDYCTQISVSQDDSVFAFHYYINSMVRGSSPINAIRTQSAWDRRTRQSMKWKSISPVAGGECCFPTKIWDTMAQVPIIPTTVTQDDFVHRALGSGVAYTGCASQRICVRNLATANTVTPIISGGWEYDSGTRDDHFSLTNGSTDLLSCRFRKNAEATQLPR